MCTDCTLLSGTGGAGGSDWQHYDRQSSGQSQSDERQALPESAVSEPAVQNSGSPTTSAQMPEGGLDRTAADLPAQSNPDMSQQHAIASPERPHDQTAVPAHGSTAPPASPFEQNEAQVRNTLTAASQPLPPEATAEVDAKAVDDRFVTMSSANALEEAVQSENDLAAPRH